MNRIILLLLLTPLWSCDEQGTKKELHPPVKLAVKFFSGTPDLPANEKQMTSAGIGNVILGNPLDSLSALYDSVADVSVYRSGIRWQAKKIYLDKDQWILAEAVNSVSQITSVYTNWQEVKTAKGFYPGMLLDSLSFIQDSLVADPEERSFILYSSAIRFKIDPVSEKKFFKLKNPDIIALQGATIAELYIVCGDC